MTLCVYAITGTQPLPSAVRGFAGEPLRLVAAGRIAAVVGELRRRPRATRSALEQYDAAIRRLHERRAIVPARFGSCFSGVDEIAFVLRSRSRSLGSALARVRRRSQMTLRFLPSSLRERPSRPARIVNSDRLAADAASRGTRYLRERAARESDIPGLGAVRNAVKRWVRAEQVVRQGEIVSVYHLVPHGAVTSYVRAVRHAAVAAGLRVVITGPWPPYAFSGW